MADKPICSIPDCGKPAVTRSFCRNHYNRFYRHGDPLKGGPTRRKPGSCTYPGCDSPKAKARGYCERHYYYEVRAMKKDRERRSHIELVALVEMAVHATTDNCITAPNAKPGQYLTIHIDGNPIDGHRYVCAAAHGEPKKGMFACHSCNNPPCVNARHLRWGSPKENTADRIKHGTDSRGEKNVLAKLNDESVRYIKSRPEMRGVALAKELGVSPSAIHLVRKGKTWAHVA